MPLLCAISVPMSTAPAAAARPATKAAEPITIAFAASTRPRSGLAASVVRIRPRRYSAVMNIVATTATAISPANVPSRKSLTVMLGPSPRAPEMRGAMSPVPDTVNRPATW